MLFRVFIALRGFYVESAVRPLKLSVWPADGRQHHVVTTCIVNNFAVKTLRDRSAYIEGYDFSYSKHQQHATAVFTLATKVRSSFRKG